VGAQTLDGENQGPLPDINFDDGETVSFSFFQIVAYRFSDDSTNLHRHARQNAQEAIALAKQRADEFDAQAALQRKTNEALKLAKAGGHLLQGLVEDTQAEENASSSGSNEPKAPLVDCKFHSESVDHHFVTIFSLQWIRTSSTSRILRL